MTSNVYCPLCGIILLPDPYANSEDPEPKPPHARPWLAEVRGIYSSDITNGTIDITGLGIIRRKNQLYAPPRVELSYIDTGIDALEEWSIFQQTQSRWCFSFHNSCWRLLLLRLSREQEGTSQDLLAIIAELLFFQLYCTPCLESSAFKFGHDYYGAARTHRPTGRTQIRDPNSYFYADPCAIDSIFDLEAATTKSRKTSGPQRWSDTHGSTITQPCQTPTHQSFSELPNELKFKIFSYLPFHELLNLRLVCRKLASLITRDELPQLYYRSRFFLGQEADFIFPDLTERRDWSRLFFGTKDRLRAGFDLSLINRKRIRYLLEPFASLVALHAVFRNSPNGSPVQRDGKSFQHTGSKSTGRASGDIKPASSFSGQLASVSFDYPLNEGCRALYYRTHPCLLWAYDRVGISTIQLGAQTFISGISLGSSGDHGSSHLVGFRGANLKDMPATSRIRAIEVAFCSEGLTGIKFLYTAGDSLGWAGKSKGPGIACGILEIPEQMREPYLVIGLDRFKVVSVTVGEMTDGDAASVPDNSMDYSRVQSHLWMPSIPAHQGLQFSALLPPRPSRSFNPLINFDFGGSTGWRLESLTRLVFYMTSTSNPLVGIEATYSDGSSLLCGSTSDCGISFFINGPEGERIDGLNILEHHPSVDIGCWQVSTNYGRYATIAPLSLLDAETRPIPIPSPNYTITGFISHLREYERRSRFLQIGIQSQQSDKHPASLGKVFSEDNRVPGQELRYDQVSAQFISTHQDNYQTFASLKNIRRIQVSTGMKSRSRYLHTITGLKFEYYSLQSPGIVGQWMTEHDQVFELGLDEEIEALTFWSTPVGYSSGIPGMEMGQIVAIDIKTSHDRQVKFRSSIGSHLPLPMELRQQYRSTPDEKLTAISWIMNASSDHVRAVVAANKSRQEALILVPKDPPPFDQIQKLYFERNSANGSESGETIVTVEAYFHDKAIIGLVFVYTTGASARVGYFDSGDRQLIRLARGATIVGLSAAGEENDLRLLEFELEHTNREAQPVYERISLGSVNSSGKSSGWRDFWINDKAPGEGHRHGSIGHREYKRPDNTRLVGMYIGCRGFSRVGALYRLESSEEGE